MKTIKNAANVAALGPLALGVVQIRDRKVLLAGVDFEASEILKPWWKIQGTIPNEDGVLLGAEAARILDCDLGGSIHIKDREFVVSGVLLPTGSQDDQLIFARLATAQLLLGKEGRISMAEVAALCKDCPIQEMVKQIASVIPGAKVMAIQQVVKGRMETIAQFKKFSYGVSAVVVLVGGLVVLVTMMGSVRERTGEIGVLRAIGFRRSHVVRVVFLEAGLISGIAGILGYFIGYVSAKGVLMLSAESQSVFVPWNLELAAGAFGLAIIIGLISSAYPALLAARLDPNEALRAL